MAKDKANNLIVLTAGGTGGHIYPADALAGELEVRGFEVMLFTDARGLNNYKGKLGEIENKAICSGSVVGKSPVTKIISLVKVAFGIVQAGWYLCLRRPRCVVGFGGYASFPTAVAAVMLRIPLVIHEQNSVMSRTNRILARFAALTAQSFRKTRNMPAGSRSFLSGMPVRQSIAALAGRKYEPAAGGKFAIIVLGGSQGAKVFAEVVPAALRLLSAEERGRIVLYQQCRKGEEEALRQKYRDMECQVTVSSFFKNIPELYQQADLVISRAGASSVYEFAAAGLPAVLVPLPSAADNHQFYNAQEFAEGGGALAAAGCVYGRSPETGIAEFFEQSEETRQMSEKIRQKAIVDAAARLADGIEQLGQK